MAYAPAFPGLIPGKIPGSALLPDLAQNEEKDTDMVMGLVSNVSRGGMYGAAVKSFGMGGGGGQDQADKIGDAVAKAMKGDQGGSNPESDKGASKQKDKEETGE